MIGIGLILTNYACTFNIIKVRINFALYNDFQDIKIISIFAPLFHRTVNNEGAEVPSFS